MRKSLKSVISMALAAAMVITSGVVATPDKATEKAAAAETTTQSKAGYNAYLAFSLTGYWIYRSPWMGVVDDPDHLGECGLNATTFKADENTVMKRYEKDPIPFDYKTYIIANNAKKTVSTSDAKKSSTHYLHKANIKDAFMTENTTYTMEITGVNSEEWKNVNAAKDDDPNAGLPYYQSISISTDIPLSVKGVKCTNATVYIDGKSIGTVATVPHNTEATTNGGCYNFMVLDQYYGTHGTKGCLEPLDSKEKVNTQYAVAPKDSIKITYTISGVDFANVKKAASYGGPMSGKNVAVGNNTYNVTTRAMDDGTMGAVSFVGSKASGAVKVEDVVSVVENGVTFKYKVNAIAANALKGNKKVKSVTIGNNVTTIGKNAFANCAKLKSVKFGAKVKSIKESAFQGCKAIKSVTLGKKTKSIGKKAFSKCVKLSKIKVFQKVKVAKKAFAGCKKTIKVSGKKAMKKFVVKQIKKSGYKKVK